MWTGLVLVQATVFNLVLVKYSWISTLSYVALQNHNDFMRHVKFFARQIKLGDSLSEIVRG